MELVGDPRGLEELKLMREERKDFLKFIITEAKTSLARQAEFKGKDGRRYLLKYDGAHDRMEVSPQE
jgi:hypothetical protein